MGPGDDFFAIGGHSLLLVKAQKGFQEKFGLSMLLPSFFSLSTVLAQGELISSRLFASKEAPNHNIDWNKERAFPANFPQEVTPFLSGTTASPDRVVLTGAFTMARAYMIHHLLQATTVKIHCLAIDSEMADEMADDAVHRVQEALRLWNMYSDVTGKIANRLVVYPGSLFDQTLGLSPDKIAQVDAETSDIYNPPPQDSTHEGLGFALVS